MACLRPVAPQKQSRPATMPITSEPVGLTKPEAGVIATRPATAPEMMPSTDGLPRVIHSANIQESAAAAALSWMFAEWMTRGKPSVLGIISGAVAGLVAITPASGFVNPTGSLVIGIVAGLLCFWGATGLKHAMGYDDSLDAF